MASSSARLCAVCGVAVPGNFRFCPFCSSVIPVEPGEAERQRAALQAALGDTMVVHERIGRGAYGLVFRATARAAGRQVAVKVLHAAHGESGLMRQRFLGGARVAAGLRHPHILPVLEIGDAGPLSYIVMPFVEGESLAAVLLREGPQPPPEAARLLREVAEALACVHQAGLVHRDVKPQHILLEGAERRALLIDFSLVCSVAGAVGPRRDVPPPEEGAVVGTPAYMSPEQAEGRFDVDARSDLYSLGVVGYQLLTGALPFEGTAEQQIVAHRVRTSRNPAARYQNIPADLAGTVMRCLGKLTANRWASAAELAAALGGERPDTTPAGVPAQDSVTPSPEPEPPTPDPASPPPASWQPRTTRPAVRYLTIPPPPPPPPPAPAAPRAPVREAGAQAEPLVVTLLPPEWRTQSISAPEAPPSPRRWPWRSWRSPPLLVAGGILLVLVGYVAVGGLQRVEPRGEREVAPATPPATPPIGAARPADSAGEPGYLTLSVLPGGAVFVDGIAVGSAPLTRHPIAPGPHLVRIERAGYRPDSLRLHVRPGLTVETRIALMPR